MVKKIPVYKRREILSNFILTKGFVTVDDLMNLVGVSRMTIHRDLDELEKLKIIQKVRNGASAQPSSLFESDWRYRERINIEEKISICKLASTFIEDGTSVFLGESTTVLPLLDFIKDMNLKIITGAIPIINKIIDFGTLELIILGGNYNYKYRSSYGKICLDTINKLRPDLSIMSSVAYKSGSIFQSEHCILSVKRNILDSAEKKMLLLDYTKFNNRSLHHLADIKEFDYIIVDNKVSMENISDMKNYNDHIYVAE